MTVGTVAPVRVRTRRQPVNWTPAFMWGLRVALFLAIIGVWEWYGNLPSTFAIAPFTDTAVAFVEGFTSGEFVSALGGTLATVAIGYSIAAVLGVGIGLWIGVSRYAQNAIEPLTNALYATPISLLIPVIAIYTGLGMQGRVILVVLWCIFEIIVTTSTGVRDVPGSLIDVARSFDASRRVLYTKVILPAARPHIVLGLRLGVARAMRGAVTAELLLAAANLGLVIMEAGARFNVPKLLAGILLTMLLGLALMTAAGALERRVLAGQRSE